MKILALFHSKRAQIKALTATKELQESRNVVYDAFSIDYEF